MRYTRLLIGTLVTVGLLAALWVSPASAQPGFNPPGLDVAIAAQERHTDALLAREGVVGTAVGLNPAGKPVVQVFTEREGVPGIPSSLDRVPVVVRVTGEFVAEDHATGEFQIPVPIGVSSSNENSFIRNGAFCTTGTLGARLVDDQGDNDPNNDVYFALSNNHIFANENESSGAVLGSPVIQPGLADSGCTTTGTTLIGTLSAYVPIEFDRRADNLADVAIASVTLADLDGDGLVDDLVVGTATPADGYGEPSTANRVCENDACQNLLEVLVKKFGRTTELTHGVISGVNGITIIKYDSGHARFIHQLIIDPVAPTNDVSAGGDSGSLWVTEVGENPVGLHFAGGSSVGIANRIDLVFLELDNDINDESTVVGTAVGGLSVDGKAPTPAVNVSLSTDKAEYTTPDETSATLTAVVTNELGDRIGGLASGDFDTTVVDSDVVVVAVGAVTFSEPGPAGTYTATLDISGLIVDSYTATVDVTDGPVTGSGMAAFSMVAPAEPGGGTGTVQGRVTNAATGQKISGAMVMVSTGEFANTNNGGKYSLADVLAGSPDITASATGCADQTVFNVEVVADGSVKQDFALDCG